MTATARRRLAATLLMTAAATGLAACDGIHDPSADGNLVPRTADEDPTIPLAGTTIHYETFGDPTRPVAISETLQALDLPFYATLGANYRF